MNKMNENSESVNHNYHVSFTPSSQSSGEDAIGNSITNKYMSRMLSPSQNQSYQDSERAVV